MWEQADGAKKFNLLFEVVKYIIVLPHSNAEERIFSTVNYFQAEPLCQDYIAILQD